MLPHPLRSDALDSRERILDTARAVFSADGLTVPTREIARRAGFGPATVYRRFPSKERLAAESFADQTHACQAIAEEVPADPDPWHGFCLVIEKGCELRARDRGFTAEKANARREPGRQRTFGSIHRVDQRLIHGQASLRDLGM